MEKMAEEHWSILGKVAIVTGSNSGIGRVTALELAKRGAGKVILACRNLAAAEEAAQEIREKVGYDSEEEAKRRVIVKKLDLSSIESVRAFAADINATEPHVHVLVNNAGLEMLERKETVDGNEMVFGTNHLGSFLLTNLLLEKLKASKPSRIVTVASKMYNFCWPWGINLEDPNCEHHYYYGDQAYCQSKLANMLTTQELHRRLNVYTGTPSGVSVFCLHPGYINSGFLRSRTGLSLWLGKFFFALTGGAITVEQGAQTSIYLATEPGVEKHSGEMFSFCQLYTPWGFGRDPVKAKALWELSEKMVSNK